MAPMYRHNVVFPDHLWSGLVSISATLGNNSISETVRALLNYSMREERVNEVFPLASGQIKYVDMRR